MAGSWTAKTLAMRMTVFFLGAGLVVSAFGATASAQSSPAYEGFNRFCIENFGAKKEELTYKIPC